VKVLLIGPPGSGKGTQGHLLAERLGVRHIAAGDLLRAEVERASPLGRRVEAMMARGELVPDLIVLALLLPAVMQAVDHGGYVLDGYPRSVPQADLSRDLADSLGLRADLALYLDVPQEELLARILARATTENRADDTEDVVRHRLRVFEEATSPLVAYYRELGVLRVVDATGPVDEITETMLGLVQQAG
jgi:adenylate kinase